MSVKADEILMYCFVIGLSQCLTVYLITVTTFVILYNVDLDFALCNFRVIGNGAAVPYLAAMSSAVDSPESPCYILSE